MLSGISDALDVRILEVAGTLRNPGLTRFMQFSSNVGDWMWEVPFMLLVGVALRIRGRASTGFWFFGVCVSAEIINALLKLLFHRARPTVISHLGLAGSFSFPSGHSLLAPVIWGLGLVLVSQLIDVRSSRIVLWTIAIALTCTIALSRIYLGVHYATDVIGGVFFGLGWVLLWWERVNQQVSVDPAKT